MELGMGPIFPFSLGSFEIDNEKVYSYRLHDCTYALGN